ncbi:MAG: HEAT repeat domain-containing protein, partial [Phormidium sp. BM_Day4_Bin.17]|nr:HEAT repeat domain-containing protein [Phormidium sp. BM_Day4_Bin.17]
KIGSEQAVEGLLAALQDKDSDEGVRRTAAYALGKIGSEEGVEGLLAALKDSGWYARMTAAQDLGNIGDARPLSDLWQLYRKRRDFYLWNAITQIQNHCQFYNYELWQVYRESQKNNNLPILTRGSSSSSIYNIKQVGILNTGDVTIDGDQIGEQPP